MIIYNVTIKVDWSIHDQWIKWMKEETIPGILATRLFYDYQFVRLLQVDDLEGPTYAVQYYAHSMEAYNRYMEEVFDWQQQAAVAAWGLQYVAFGTVMQAVE